MTTRDILTAALFAAPVGFGLSALAGSLILRGPRRLLSVAALAFSGVAAALPVLQALRPRGLTIHRIVSEEIMIVCLFWAVTAIYLAHTYYPTADRRITLPATLGMFGTAGAATLLLAYSWL